MRLLSIALFGTMTAAYGQHLIVTMRTHPGCPVSMSAVSKSTEFGFDSVTLQNDSKKFIDRVNLKVSLISESEEEIVDGASFLVQLESGQSKPVDVGLGRILELSNRSKSFRRGFVQAVLSVESIEFSDGSKWTDEEPAIIDVPVRPVR